MVCFPYEQQVPALISGSSWTKKAKLFLKRFLEIDDVATQPRGIVPPDVSGMPEPSPSAPCTGLCRNGELSVQIK